MLKKTPLLLLIILFSVALSAQENEDAAGTLREDFTEETAVKPHEEFFFGISPDVSMYSAYGFSYGAGLTIGYGTGSALGLKMTWFFSTDKVDTLEINFFLRFYFLGKNASKGPYVQLMGGPSIFFDNGNINMPAYVGAFSAGLGIGWRFNIARIWFVEPFVRGGYPYIINGGITAGLRL